MNFSFTHAGWLVLVLTLPWFVWLVRRSYVHMGAWRRWASLLLRVVICLALVLAIAGVRWMRPLDGMNVMFLLDRSDSVPSQQQEAARAYINRVAAQKRAVDKAGLIVFGTDAAVEFTPNLAVDVQKIQAVVGTERTDLAAAIRLGTAAFGETGQKRLVLASDGNENLGDAFNAVLAAKPLGVTVDVLPMGVTRGGDVSVQKLSLPNSLKRGQPFEVKILALADQARPAKVRLYRNDQLLGEQTVDLSAGKNLFSFPQTLNESGFYAYDVQVEAPGDLVPQNNRASNFAHVRGEPRVLLIAAEPAQDASLAAALRASRLEVVVVDVKGMPATLGELQSYDSIFLSNVAAGDLGTDLMRLIESAVRDFGVGFVCVGGDQTYAAGGYRGTPLEATLPVDMELSSKKVLPSGALALVMHGMEFNNGNQVARDTALGVLDALGPQDELGVLLWDGGERWLFPMTKVGDRKALGAQIAGMNQGDLPNFQNLMVMAHEGLKKSAANLKHIIVFSDGDPGAPTKQLLDQIVGDRITVSTVMIGAHVKPDTMMWMADVGRGRFYDVRSAAQLPQIFIKEAAVILKSAIYEEPFKPQLASSSEVLRGIGAAELPTLRGYVAATPKPRAEIPLISDKGDPVLAHWQYGLGRAIAFTSDAKARWAVDWLSWEKYRQFWSQAAQWSLRRMDSADFNTEISVDKGEGSLSVEAVDEQGNYRNFLNLQAIVVSPKGERQTVRLEQSGPGRYETKFATREVGAYLVNLAEVQDGKPRGAQVLGASVNYSPEFASADPDLNLLQRLAEAGGGRVLKPADPADNPFLHDRVKTFQPRDLWEWLLKLAIVLFVFDVAVRRIQLDREEWVKVWRWLVRRALFWRGIPRPAAADESLVALLARRNEVRASQQKSAPAVEPVAKSVIAAPVVVPAPAPPVASAPEPAAKSELAASSSTASRLLEARRRARVGSDSRRPDDGERKGQ